MKKLFLFAGFVVIFLTSTAFADSLTNEELELCKKAWKRIEMTPEEIKSYYDISREERYDAIRKFSVGKRLTDEEYEVYKKVWKRIELTPKEQDVYDDFSKEKREMAYRMFFYAPGVLADPVIKNQTTDYSF